MESPVIVDKPPEYHNRQHEPDNQDDSGFPFDEDSGSEDVWNDLAARHPDIAARIRAGRDGTWGPRKRRSSQQPDESSRNVNDHFQGFPFDDIPSEFRQHFPSHWGERFSPRSTQQERYYQPQEKEVKVDRPTNSSSSSTQETATQTVDDQSSSSNPKQSSGLPQYGLRNTVDLGQKTPAEPGQIDAEQARNQRSMSAPPDNRPASHQPQPRPVQQHMGNSQQHQQTTQQQEQQQPNVRHIPIFVEGRDEPVINKNVDHTTTNFTEQRGPSPQPAEREIPRSFNQPPHFSKAFGAPFKGFRQTSSPFSQPRGFQQQQHQDEIPKVFRPTSKSPPPAQQQHSQHPQHPQSQPQQQPQQEMQPPQEQQSVPPPKSTSADPISKIQLIQKDVLDLMTQVETFAGNGRKDKQYMYLDEMLTRNLIKLDDIDTEGKENIRQARKEAIKCIQKCIAVLEVKADASTKQNSDVNMECQNNVPDSEMKEFSSQDVPNDSTGKSNNTGSAEEQNNTKIDTKVDSSQQANGETKKKEAQATEAPDFKTNTNKTQLGLTPMEVDQNTSSQQ